MNDLMFNRKVFAAFLVSVFVVSALLIAVPVRANPGILYVDDDGICEGNNPCYIHPQDAVNAATAGDTIMVYPGYYGSRQFKAIPPHWGPNDQWAPALIVYKDNLVIKAVNSDPSLTVIESTHNFWSNPVAIQASTGGTWDGTKYVGAGVYPKDGTAPSAVIIVANGVTIEGFTLKRHFEGTWATYNTAGVFIGDLFAGGSQFLGAADGATVQNCVFEDVWHAVYMWHTSHNRIIYNTVKPLSSDHWAAISVYDGYNDAQIGLGHLSQYNEIAHNTLANKGIAVGAWAPPINTDNTGTSIHDNTATYVGITYSNGPKFLCNNILSGGYWFAEESGHYYCALTSKEFVLNDLKDLRASVTDKKDGKKLDEAIEHLANSLDAGLWVDGTHLQAKHGDKVFNEEKDAVVKLLELIKDKKSNVDKAKLQDFINRLVEADKLLALVAIEDAVAASGDAKKIDKANDELGKGDARVADGHFTDAIEHYRNAWKHAIQAV